MKRTVRIATIEETDSSTDNSLECGVSKSKPCDVCVRPNLSNLYMPVH